MEQSVSFWRRIGAYYIDSLVLVCVAAMLGMLFRPLWLQSEAAALFAGILLTLIYFTVLNSSLSGGQTAGKCLLKVRVVDRHLQTLSLRRAFFRAIVVALPLTIMFWISVFPATTVATTYAYWVGYFTPVLCSTYLFLFNRRSRQCIHDLMAGSYVVHSDAESVPDEPIWRGHGIALLLIGGLAVLMAKPDIKQFNTEAFQVSQQVRQSLNQAPGVIRSAVMVVPRSSISGSTSMGEVGLVKINVRVDSHDRFRQSFTRELSEQLLEQFPELRSADELQYSLHFGFQLGGFKHRDERTFSFSPNSDAGGIDLAGLFSSEP